MFDDFYGLQARPFQLTPDPEFYFESLTHRKALSYLGYGLAQGEGFVVITGEVGLKYMEKLCDYECPATEKCGGCNTCACRVACVRLATNTRTAK